MDFESELDDLRERKRTLEEEIEQLEDQIEKKSSNTEQIRRDIEALKKSMETGRVPDEEASEDSRLIPKVEVNPETGKPPRGARGEQIERAIEVISRRQETFKASELFELIQAHDPDFEENQRDYMYSKLNDMRDQGELEKVARGTWTVS